ncbi:MAG: thiaminase II [Nitrososphaeria archaeon]
MVSEKFRKKACVIWDEILRHPFLRELKEGTLPKESFRFFVAQDYIFLKDMSKSLGYMASKAMDNDSKDFLLNMKQSSETIEVDGIIKLGSILGGIDFNKVWYAPTCYAYTRHLLYTASSKSFFESIAAVAPCYWSYMMIGDALEGSPDKIYDEWIKTYRSQEYKTLISKFIDIMNKAGERSPEKMNEAMNAFLISSEYEYMFWEMAYKKEGWFHNFDLK